MSSIERMAIYEARQRELGAKKEAELKAAEAEKASKQALELSKVNALDIESIKKELSFVNDFIISLETKVSEIEGNFDFVVDGVRKNITKLDSEFKEFKKEIKDTVGKINTSVAREVSAIRSEMSVAKTKLQKLIENKGSKQEMLDQINQLNLKIWAFDQKTTQIIHSKIDILKQELKDEDSILFNKIAGKDGIIEKTAFDLEAGFKTDMKNAKEEISELFKNLGDRVSFVEADVNVVKSELSVASQQLSESQNKIESVVLELTKELESVSGASKADAKDLEKVLLAKIEESYKDKFQKIAKMFSGEVIASEQEIQDLVNVLKKDSQNLKLEFTQAISDIKTVNQALLTKSEFEQLSNKLSEVEKKFSDEIDLNKKALNNLNLDIILIKHEISAVNDAIVSFEASTLNAAKFLESEISKLSTTKIEFQNYKKLSSNELTKAIQNFEKLIGQKADNQALDDARNEMVKHLNTAKEEFAQKLKLEAEKIASDFKSKLSGQDLSKALEGIANAQNDFETQLAQVTLDLSSVKNEVSTFKMEMLSLNNLVNQAKGETISKIENLAKELESMVKADEVSKLKSALEENITKLSDNIELKVKDLADLINSKSSQKEIDILKAVIKSEVESAKQSFSEELDLSLSKIKVGMTDEQITQFNKQFGNAFRALALQDNKFDMITEKMQEIKLLQVTNGVDKEALKIVEQAKTIDAMSDLIMHALMNESNYFRKKVISSDLMNLKNGFAKTAFEIAKTNEEKQQVQKLTQVLDLFANEVMKSVTVPEGSDKILHNAQYDREISHLMAESIVIINNIMMNKITAISKDKAISEEGRGLISSAKNMLVKDAVLARKEYLATLTYKLSNDVAASIQSELSVNTSYIKSQVSSLSKLVKEIETGYVHEGLSKNSAIMNDLVKVEQILKDISLDLAVDKVNTEKLLLDVIALNSVEIEYFNIIKDNSRDFNAQEYEDLWSYDSILLKGMNMTLKTLVASGQAE